MIIKIMNTVGFWFNVTTMYPKELYVIINYIIVIILTYTNIQ